MPARTLHPSTPWADYSDLPLNAALVSQIEYSWKLDAATAPQHRIFPDGVCDLVIVAGKGYATAPATTSFLLPRQRTLVGLRIRPGAAAAVFGASPKELGGAPVSLELLWGREGRQLQRMLEDITSPLAASNLLQQFVQRRLVAGSSADPIAMNAAQRLRQAPDLNVCRLAATLGLGERQLRRRFERSVGIGLKQFARIARFQHALERVRQHRRRNPESPGWALLAAECGYADQAHLIREVRSFAGLTPVELLQTL